MTCRQVVAPTAAILRLCENGKIAVDRKKRTPYNNPRKLLFVPLVGDVLIGVCRWQQPPCLCCVTFGSWVFRSALLEAEWNRPYPLTLMTTLLPDFCRGFFRPLS